LDGGAAERSSKTGPSDDIERPTGDPLNVNVPWAPRRGTLSSRRFKTFKPLAG